MENNNEFSFFDRHYAKGGWGASNFGSGPGSTVEHTKEYVKLINQILQEPSPIKRIVDIGCGDWEFMQHVNLTGKEYIGIDVSKLIVDRNTQKFSKPNVSFLNLNPVFDDIPDGDIFFMKDVLQHLPDNHVDTILKKLIKKKGWALITNDGTRENTPKQISTGRHRNLNVLLPPFNFPGVTVLRFHKKQVILSALNG